MATLGCTSNIQALDMLEAIQKKGAHEAFLGMSSRPCCRARAPRQRALLQKNHPNHPGRPCRPPPNRCQWRAKDALRRLADVAQVGLLYRLAQTAGERYAQLAELYAHKFILGNGYPVWASDARDIWDLFAD